MTFQQRIRKWKVELPLYLEKLIATAGDLADPVVRQDRLRSLTRYQQDMAEGFDYLVTLDRATIRMIEAIAYPDSALLRKNFQRYIKVLQDYRKDRGISGAKKRVTDLIQELAGVPFVHASKDTARVMREGISPAADLWLSSVKTSANPMDMALRLHFDYVFCTQGFVLTPFSKEFVRIDPALICEPSTLVSSVDIYKMALCKNKLQLKKVVRLHPSQWISSLSDYRRQIFRGSDFFELKAEYIATFFKDVTAYHRFAERHYYANTIRKSPPGEYPFLGEIKILGCIDPKYLRVD